MISSNKKRDLTIFSTILLLLFLSFLTSYDVRQQDEISKKLYRFMYVFTEILSLDIGLSHHENLREPFKDRQSNTIMKLAGSFPATIKYKIFGSEIPRIDFDVKHLEWQQILNNKELNATLGNLADQSYVKAEIRFQDQVYKAKIKLKGYGIVHRIGSKRFSLTVSLSEGKTILGFSKFSLQKPLARYFPFDYIFQRLVSDSKHLGPAKGYGNIYVNGENWGVMNLEESLTKEFLEKKASKQSIVIRYPNMFDDDIWKYMKLTEDDPYPWYRSLESYFHIHLYDDNKYLEDPQFRKYFSYIQEKSVFDRSEILDTKKMAEVFLLASIWGNWHTLLNYNLRFYFNPYTLKLDPIVTDQTWPVDIQDNAVEALNRYKLPLIFELLLQQEEFQQELRSNFDHIAERFNEIDKYSAESEALFPVDKTHDLDFLKSNIIYLSKNLDLFFNVQNFASRSILSSQENKVFSVPPPNQEQAKNFIDHVYPRHFSDGYLEVYNLLPDDTKILKVFSNGEEIPFTPISLKGYLSDPLPVRINLNLNGIRDNKISLLTEYQSNLRTTDIKSSIISEGTFNPLTADNYLCQSICTIKNGEYFFNSGTWSIEEPIILDGNVNIPPGTTLNFEENAYMIIKGSLTAVGTQDLPIKLSSINQSWKGLYVINAFKRSLLENVQIENLNALTDGLLNLTGGVNFYNSDLTFKNSIIANIFAEDALNVVKSEFILENITITHAASDAVDSDFSEGLIVSSAFENISGDALDFSGSRVTISQVETNNIGDKSISAGEQSNLFIEESRLRNTAIGITSKDGSKVTVKDSTIESYDLFGVMSYVKKDFYLQKPSIELMNCIVDDGARYLRQTGSSMTVDGKNIAESQFDVDLLYSQSDDNPVLIQ